jgi:hypothetical protein
MRSEIADMVVSAMKEARRFRQVEGMFGFQMAGIGWQRRILTIVIAIQKASIMAMDNQMKITVFRNWAKTWNTGQRVQVIRDGLWDRVGKVFGCLTTDEEEKE